MRAWGSGSCSLHSRIPSIQDGRQGVWKEKGGAGGRARSVEEPSAAASLSWSLGPGRRVEGRPARTRAWRGKRGWRDTRGREKGSEARKESQEGGKGRERAREEGGGGQRNLRRAMCRYRGSSALFGFLLSARGGGALAFLSPLPSPLTRRHLLYFSFWNTNWGAPGMSF